MILSSTERFVAWRYLRAPRNEGIITLTSIFALVGIALGVATLIVVTSVMNGFREELFERMLGFTAEAVITAPGAKIDDPEQWSARAQEDEHVRSATSLVEGQALLSVRGYSTGVLLRGLSAASLPHKPRLFRSLSEESRADFAAEKGAMIGEQLALRLGIELGDSLVILVPQGVPTAFGSLPNEATLLLVGIFKSEIYEYDNGFVLLPLGVAQNLLGYGQSVDSIELRLEHPEQAASVQRRLQNLLPENLAVRTWQEQHSSLHEALIVERNVMFLILTLIVLIAAFNIVSGQVMLVQDKRQGIAVLRSLGMSPSSVLRIFLAIGCSIGITGTFFGALLGLLFAKNITSIERFIEYLFGVKLFPFDVYSLPSLPSRIDLSQVAVILSLAVVVSFASALYPARRAAKLSPIDILRSS